MYEGGLRRRMTVMTTTVTTLLRRLAGPVQCLPEAGTTDLVLRLAGPADAAAIDRLVGMVGRDPGWTPPQTTNRYPIPGSVSR